MASEPLGAAATDEEFAAKKREVDGQVLDFSNAFLKMMLSLVGIELPDYALEISDLVSIDNKRRFAEEFLPRFQKKAERHAVRAQFGRRSQ